MPVVPRFAAAPGSRAWIALLAALNAIVALGVDMSLPAQQVLVEHFAVPEPVVTLTISLFLIGFAVGQLGFGYISDARGRRSVLLVGLALFTASGVACALSPTVELLIVFRVLQGLSAAAAPVIVRAMIRDTQPAAGAARLLSGMLAALAIAPMIAPTIGGVLLELTGWRGIFATLAITGFVLFTLSALMLADTLPVEGRAAPSIRGMLGSYATFFRTTGTKLPMLVSCCSFAGQFAYIASSPFILMQGYGVSRRVFGYYFALTAIALMLGSLTGGRMLRAGRSPGGMIVVGTSLLLTGGILVVIGTRIEGLGILGFIVPMIVYFFGSGISGPSASALAMEPVPQIAGTASAIVGFLITSSGAVSGTLTTKIGGSSSTTFSLVVGVMGAIAWAIAVLAAVLRRRRIDQKQQLSR